MSSKEYRSGWSYIGEGLAWFFILIGFGGCVFLVHLEKGSTVRIHDNTILEIK